MAESTFRLRVTYGKTGRLRFLSHLEVVHACERCIRRAGLLYAVTQGFSPKMKMSFGPALPVGTAGLGESYDVWLTRFVSPVDALAALRAASLEDLAPTEARYAPGAEPAQGASTLLAEYEVAITGPGIDEDSVRQGLEAVLDEGSVTLMHKGKAKVYELGVHVPDVPVVGGTLDGAVVGLTTRIGSWGSMRPEALVTAALERAALSGEIVRVTRTGLHKDEAAD